MAKQKDLVDVGRSVLGEKAVEFLNLKDEIDNSKEELDKIKEELVNLFIKENKSSINVDGRIVSYAHLENDKITVKDRKIEGIGE